MLDSWNQSIFGDIKQRLQDSAMKLVRAERNGEAFDSQLVIGVRESYGKIDGKVIETERNNNSFFLRCSKSLLQHDGQASNIQRKF